MDGAKVELFQPCEQGGGRRRSGNGHDELPLERVLLGMVHQENLYGGCAVIVCNSFLLKELPHQSGINLAQADMRTSHGSHGPGKAPAIAMEHWQRPQIDTLAVHAGRDDFGERVEVGATSRVHDAFRIAGGARGVVDRNRLVLIFQPAHYRLWRSLSKEPFVWLTERPPITPPHHFDLFQVEPLNQWL